MHRRTILTGIAAAVPIGLAGCTGGAGGGSGGTDTTTEPSETDTTTELESPDILATLTPREECPNPGEATVSFDTPVSIVGCVVGRNGCTVPRLANVDYDSEARTLTVVVAAVDESDNETACTQQIVHLGYEVELTDVDIDPTSVEVVHDDRNGRRTVVDVTQ